MKKAMIFPFSCLCSFVFGLDELPKPELYFVPSEVCRSAGNCDTEQAVFLTERPGPFAQWPSLNMVGFGYAPNSRMTFKVINQRHELRRAFRFDGQDELEVVTDNQGRFIVYGMFNDATGFGTFWQDKAPGSYQWLAFDAPHNTANVNFLIVQPHLRNNDTRNQRDFPMHSGPLPKGPCLTMAP